STVETNGASDTDKHVLGRYELLLEGIIVRFPGNFWRQWQEWSAGIGKKRTEAHSVEFIRVYPKSRLQERCTPCNVEQQSCTEGRELSSCWLVMRLHHNASVI